MYIPAEDTFFLADHIKNQKGHMALEIGTGSGYLAKILEENFEFVVATDIEFSALKSQQARPKNTICCDAASAIGAKFDLIVCNLPYLPTDDISDRATDGGPEGLAVPLHIIQSATPCLKPGGRMLVLSSSVANYTKLIKEIKTKNLQVRIVGKKKMFFEELILLELKIT